MTTFNKWLKKNIDKDDPIGDLARDVKRDSRPKPSNTIQAWRTFLKNGFASDAALATLEEAWNIYKVDNLI